MLGADELDEKIHQFIVDCGLAVGGLAVGGSVCDLCGRKPHYSKRHKGMCKLSKTRTLVMGREMGVCRNCDKSLENKMSYHLNEQWYCLSHRHGRNLDLCIDKIVLAEWLADRMKSRVSKMRKEQ